MSSAARLKLGLGRGIRSFPTGVWNWARRSASAPGSIEMDDGAFAALFRPAILFLSFEFG